MSLLLGAQSVAPLFRRLGPVFAVAGAAVAALTWPRAYDLGAYLAAAQLVAAGEDPYAGSRAMGIDTWGQGLTYLSPPAVAQILSPFANLPVDVVFVGWVVASLVVLIGATRVVTQDTLVAQAPMVVFSFAYIWGSLWIGQVNLFALGGLLLAFGSRNQRLAGLGLSLAIATRALPLAFAVVLVVERRWKALAWCAAALAIVVVIDPSAWASYVALLRDAAAVPTQPVIVQTSVAPWPVLWVTTFVVIAAIVLMSAAVKRDRVLLMGTAIGLAMILLPSNAWHHWLSFALAPLLLFGDTGPWSRRAILLFVIVSFLPIGILSTAVAEVTLVAMLVVSARNLRDAWPLVRPKPVGILGPP